MVLRIVLIEARLGSITPCVLQVSTRTQTLTNLQENFLRVLKTHGKLHVEDVQDIIEEADG